MTPNISLLKGRFESEYLDILKSFYSKYLFAVNYADDVDAVFRHEWLRVEHLSLCDLLTTYCLAHGYDNNVLVWDIQEALFVHSGLNKRYPFNDTDDNYLNEARDGKHHINAKRIAFVQYWVEHIDELKGGNYYD